MFKAASRRERRIRAIILAATVAGGVGGATAAHALDPLGLYVGAGVGVSTVRSDNDFGSALPGTSQDRHTAWKVMVGARPLSVLGAEFDYIDFGHASNADPYTYGSATYGVGGVHTHPRASALFAVGYLPLPLPLVDVYGKLGLARLDTTIDGTASAQVCPASGMLPVCPPGGGSIHDSRSGTDFAYGAGVQMRMLGVAFRAEYERIASSYGDPDVFSLSVLWNF